MKLRVLFILVAVGLVSLSAVAVASEALRNVNNGVHNGSETRQLKPPKSRIGATGVMAFLVKDIVPGSPAEQAGLRQGDIVLSLNGEQIDSINDFLQPIAESEPGTVFEIGCLRQESGKLQELKLRVKTAPSGTIYK